MGGGGENIPRERPWYCYRRCWNFRAPEFLKKISSNLFKIHQKINFLSSKSKFCVPSSTWTSSARSHELLKFTFNYNFSGKTSFQNFKYFVFLKLKIGKEPSPCGSRLKGSKDTLRLLSSSGISQIHWNLHHFCLIYYFKIKKIDLNFGRTAMRRKGLSGEPWTLIFLTKLVTKKFWCFPKIEKILNLQ